MNYRDAYYKLFNEITDLIDRLKDIQTEVEKIVIVSNDEIDLRLINDVRGD